jgi:hypothetical protein
MHCGRPDDGTRIWRTPEAVHIDVRGLDPPEPMVAILRLIDLGEADCVLIAHLDREPIFLYPELDDRGWSHDIIRSPCHELEGSDEVVLQMTRWLK